MSKRTISLRAVILMAIAVSFEANVSAQYCAPVQCCPQPQMQCCPPMQMQCCPQPAMQCCPQPQVQCCPQPHVQCYPAGRRFRIRDRGFRRVCPTCGAVHSQEDCQNCCRDIYGDANSLSYNNCVWQCRFATGPCGQNSAYFHDNYVPTSCCSSPNSCNYSSRCRPTRPRLFRFRRCR